MASMEGFNLEDLKACSAQQIEKCSALLAEVSSSTERASAEDKEGLFDQLRDVFNVVKTLTQYISGDYDARVKAKELEPAASESPLITALVQTMEAAFHRSANMAKAAQERLLSIIDTRLQVGKLRTDLDGVISILKIQTAQLQEDLLGKRRLANEAEKSKSVAENAYNDAKVRCDTAETSAKRMEQASKWDPFFIDPGIMGSYGAIVLARRAREAAKIEAQALEDRKRELGEIQTALAGIEADQVRAEFALTDMENQRADTSSSLERCEAVIELCRGVEKTTTACKQSLNHVLRKCTDLEEIVTRGDYVQTKSDHVEVILECLTQGGLNSTLVGQAKAIFDILESGDSTALLKDDKFSKFQIVIRNLSS